MSTFWKCTICGLKNNTTRNSCQACFNNHKVFINDHITQHTVNKLASFKTSLINGYCNIYCNKYIPLEITKLCILYCFIFDEFNSKQIASISQNNIEIIGLNNSIAVIRSSKLRYCISTSNLITSSGHYHWAFRISVDSFDGSGYIAFGFIQNGSSLLSPHIIEVRWCECHIYLNKHEHIVTYKMNNAPPKFMNLNINDMDGIHLAIKCKLNVNQMQIEMTEYHDSNCYHNLSNPMHHIGYAQCIYDINEKIKHYKIALQSYPFSEAWNNAYLYYLRVSKQFDIAYNHIMQYKKGQDSIARITQYYYMNGNNEYVHQLIKILDDEQLKKKDLYFAAGYVCNEFDENQKAVNYYQLFLDQHRDETDDNTMERKLLCIGNMAKSYDKKKALEIFLELDDETLKNSKLTEEIAYCYDSFEQYDKALFYYKLSLNKDTLNVHSSNIWILTRISYIYYTLKDYQNARIYYRKCLEIGADKDFTFNSKYGIFLCEIDRNYEESRKYFLKALDLAPRDYDKGSIYTSLGVTAYKMGKIEDAIKYTELSIKNSKINLNFAIRMSNLGKYHYKLEEYNESFKYLSKAIQIDGNDGDVIGNYGIILYYLQRYDESIIYLDKCLSILEDVSDPELLPDCLLIYAQILFDRTQYQQSIKKCFEALQCDEFIHYSTKHKIYYLMSKIFSKLNQLEQAMEYLVKAKQSKQNDSFYTTEIKKLQQIINNQ